MECRRAYTVYDKLCNDTEAGIRAAKHKRSRRVFPACVPCSDEQKKPRRDTAFKCALEPTENEQLREVLAKSDAEHAYAPYDHVDGQGETHLVSLHDDCAWELETHVSDV